ncbi:Integral membrane protein, YjbE family [uncultured Gammaproteobacteria bacterium]
MLSELAGLGQVILIDLVLAGDNAIVVALVAAEVPAERRLRVIFWGISAAVVMRIVFSLGATRLLAVLGLTFAGGLLLLGVCWKLFCDLRCREQAEALAENELGDQSVAGVRLGLSCNNLCPSNLGAVGRILVADVSMSLDNVLAVAGAARDRLLVLTIGLVLSVAFMGVAANLFAHLLERHHWIAYLGLTVITYVAVSMIWIGGAEILVALT